VGNRRPRSTLRGLRLLRVRQHRVDACLLALLKRRSRFGQVTIEHGHLEHGSSHYGGLLSISGLAFLAMYVLTCAMVDRPCVRPKLSANSARFKI
jgi:hypothetical protein